MDLPRENPYAHRELVDLAQDSPRSLALLRFLRMFRLLRLFRLVRVEELLETLENHFEMNLKILRVFSILVSPAASSRTNHMLTLSCAIPTTSPYDLPTVSVPMASLRPPSGLR